MKKLGFVHRLLVILLVMIMVVQVVPTGVWAIAVNDIASGNYVGDPGVDTSTLDKEGAIRWPVKIYDYLNDGMLFEYANALHESSDVAGLNAYAGGELTPVLTLGTDYTQNWAYAENAYGNHATYGRGTWYTLKRMPAVPFQTPQYLHVAPGTGDNSNVEVSNFAEDNRVCYTPARVRYMTVVYRSQGTSDDVLRLLVRSNSSSSSSVSGYYYYGVDMTLEDSAEWRYLVLDLKEALGESLYDNLSYLAGIWFSCEIDKGSSDYFDLSHVAYFTNEIEAKNYGKHAAAFDANPGEYLDDRATIISGGTVQPEKPEPSAILSLRYRYKTKDDTTSTNLIEGVGNYGMDFTQTSVAEGHYANAYNSDTYWTWESGIDLTLRYDSGTRTQTMTPMTVTQLTEVNNHRFVRLTNGGSNTGYSQILLSKFREETADNNAPSLNSVNYAVLVYRANNMTTDRFAFWAAGYNSSGTYKYAGVEDTDSWLSSQWTNSIQFAASHKGWTYMVVPLYSTIYGNSSGGDTDMANVNYLKRLGMYLPALTNGKSLDLAYVAYFDTNAKAEAFGKAGAGYMNSGVTVGTSSEVVTSRGWNMGNNQNFGLLFATCGGSWAGTQGGSNSDPNGYYSWMIGYRTDALSGSASNTNRMDINGNKYTAFYTSSVSTNTLQNVSGTTNNVYYLSAGYNSSPEDGLAGSGYQTKVLDFDGYELIETVTKGIMTAGLLEGSLKNGVPVYRQEVVEYIAMTLYNALPINQMDSDGDYNYNFVKGAPSTQYGGYDLNGDGVLGQVDLNADGYAETNENSVDLATALRGCLGVKLSSGTDRGSSPTLGTYTATAAKGDELMGAFKDCRNNITTCMDAAYYLLNNVFMENTYNQLQDDYSYLALSSTPTENGGTAYIFDAGFSTGIKGSEATDGYAENSKSAMVFDPYVSYDENGNAVQGEGVISLDNVNSKDMFWYSWSDTYSTGNTTTRFPFLPVTDAEGDYGDDPTDPNDIPGSTSYYFVDDGVRSYTEEFGTYVTRNYNYVLVSNGEFVYRAEDDLFFQFEGDDDVYLFINGELVLDIGGAHSITSAQINVDDYVNAAREILLPLEEYGYHSSMTSQEFEELLKTLPDGVLADDISLDEYRRWQKLDLVDGQICTFDFYYMERHGYGANMRIFTNMHVTDPKLGVEKKAYQYDDEVEFGGVVDPSASIEYNFKLTNNGNTKLYNLTFKDDVIGVNLTPENGLVTNSSLNGTYLVDAFGGTLEASDLSAHVEGYDRNGEFTAVDITFANNEELKNFLNCLDGEGLESDYDDAEVTNAGSGLWVGASVTIKGIYYYLTPEQVEEGTLTNTVYVTGTTRIDPNDLASQVLRSDATHRVYTSGAPVYYQWAGHDLFMREQKLLDDATQAAGQKNSQLSLYEQFFDTVGNDTSKIFTRTCDKFGQKLSYSELTSYTDAGNNWGFLINYPEGGVEVFYILMYLKAGANGTDADGKTVGYESGASISSMKEGEYAIIRVTVYVAEVNDSVYVLDYGLKTESLDTDGELFKHDYLFGGIGSVKNKLMGVTTTKPSYMAPRDATTVTNVGTTGDDRNKTTAYNRIDFDPLNLSGNKKVEALAKDGKAAGYFTVNLAIPKTGKQITFDSNSGFYSLTGAGTVTVNAEVPLNWENVFLYYWYDGKDVVSWPGIPMNYISSGKYYLDIPGNVSHVIINNGTESAVDLQTEDLSMTPGVESTVKVTVDNQNNVSATVTSVVEFTKVHVAVPEDWGTTYLYYWDDNDQSDTPWPGIELVDVDENGFFVADIPGEASAVAINNGETKQTVDLDINAGQEVWLEVKTDGVSTGDDGKQYYQASINYTYETSTVYAKVPSTWGTDIKVYYWREGSETKPVEWPGVAMTLGKDGWYVFTELPGDITRIIINDGTNQTGNLVVNDGADVWITVNNLKDSKGQYTAQIAYSEEGDDAGFTFTPTEIMNSEYSLWLALTSHTTGFTPSAFGEAVDINNEVQMFKKVTMLPATVVYYEDDFTGIKYNKPEDETEAANMFTYYGMGSGSLVQSVDQDMVYGQDTAYESGTNGVFSGNHMYRIKVTDTSTIATFDFNGNGFEIVGRTNAVDSASLTVGVYKPAEYSAFATAQSAFSETYGEYVDAYLKAKNSAASMLTANANDLAAYNKLAERYEEYMIWYNEYQKSVAEGMVDTLTPDVLLEAPVDITNAAVPAEPTVGSVYADYITAYEEYLKAYNTYLTAYAAYVTDGTAYGTAYDEYLAAYDNYLTSFEKYKEDKESLDKYLEELKTTPGTATSTDYYLFGYINGANYACEEDWENLGQYRFVSGKLVAKFEKDSYVAVKSGDNAGWFMTNGWLGETNTATLYNSSTLAEANKLFIPGGVEVVFELVENSDGTKTLTYTITEKYLTDLLPVAPVAPQTLVAPQRTGAFRRPNAVRLVPVITQYDNQFNEGRDIIDQVPVFRIKSSLNEDDLPWGNYTVEICGSPTYDFDKWASTGYDPDLLSGCVKTTWLYLDGVRIFRPLGATNDAYSDTENGATFSELRDLILTGKVAVADFDTNGLSVSSGSVTWTEDLLKDPFTGTFLGNKVDDTGDYLLDGPNNETYMLGGDSAVVMYVAETGADTDPHSLQVAIRALDYGKFTGGNPTGLYAQLQYGVLENGSYAWKNLTTVVSGTEQYYVIPYKACPVVNGNYQVVLRVANSDNTTTPMISYTSVKTLGVEIKTVEGTGEATNMYFSNGVLVKPEFYLNGTINGVTYKAPASGDAEGTEYLCFDGNDRLEISFTKESSFTIDMVLPTGTTNFAPNGNVTEGTSAQLGKSATLGTDAGTITFAAGTNVVFTLDEDGSILNLTWEKAACAHDWGTGTVTTEPTCDAEGERTYTCSKCGQTKTESIDATGHTIANGVCTVCGEFENSYYLFGYINGANYACEEDYANLGIYKFVKGKLTATFNSDSYIAIKTGDNANWFMAQSYIQTTSGTFYNTSTGTAEKMFVPGGVELNFTLALNADGSLTLSYTTASDVCSHSYTSEVTTAATCDTDGKITYTCSLCGHSYTETVNATGHSFTDGTCTVCGASESTSTEYYLFGYINGANYACEEDYANMGDYKFVDGKLTATFTADSYVAVKTGGNAGWYMTNGWLGTEITTATLYNTSSGIEANKLFVPGGVEVTFTLTYSSTEDTVTLSYTTAQTASVLNMVQLRAQMAADVVVNSGEPNVSVVDPELQLSYASVSFEDMVKYNVYFTAGNLQDVVEMGMITFHSKLENGTVADAAQIIPGFLTKGDQYEVSTNGIAAKDMGENLYFRVYAKLADGSYAYSKVAYYNAVMYAKNILNGSGYSAASKALVVAMLNYGAAAQRYFGSSGSLMNGDLTAAQQELVSAYDSTMMNSVVKADSSKLGDFTATGGFSKYYPSVVFEGAFSINYYFVPANAVEGEMTFYYWNEEAYTGCDELTADNATKVVTMSGSSYCAAVEGIAAKDLDSTVYVAAVYTANGTTYCTGVLAYSIGAYCVSQASLKSSTTIGDFAEATAVYGYYTKAFFAQA